MPPISAHANGLHYSCTTGGVDVIGNILVRSSRAGIHLHNGRDNWMENNIWSANSAQEAIA